MDNPFYLCLEMYDLSHLFRRVCKIIMACCVLHNICLERNIPLPDDAQQNHAEQDQPNQQGDQQLNNNNHRQGLDVRNALIQTWFTR